MGQLSGKQDRMIFFGSAGEQFPPQQSRIINLVSCLSIPPMEPSLPAPSVHCRGGGVGVSPLLALRGGWGTWVVKH